MSHISILKSKKMAFDLDLIKKVYAALPDRIATARKMYRRPIMTFTEKILYSHLNSPFAKGPEWLSGEEFVRGKSYVDFFPDRVAIDRKSVV